MGAHRASRIGDVAEGCAAQVMAPADSPDFIQLHRAVLVKDQGFPARGEGRAVDALDSALVQAIGPVMKADTRGWFKHGCAFRKPAAIIFRTSQASLP